MVSFVWQRLSERDKLSDSPINPSRIDFRSTITRANPHRFSFDDITSAMLALFEVLSFKGWVDIREALLKRFDNSVSSNPMFIDAAT